jgi:signal peptidase I
MEPTLRLGDHVWTSMHYFSGHTVVHGEVVLITRPNGIMIFKRVVALPGDTIEGRKGVIYLNRKAFAEPYVEHIGCDCSERDSDFLQNFGPTTLQAGECFVLGDNRDRSLDSRHPDFGLVPISTITGKPLYIVASERGFHRWERIE